MVKNKKAFTLVELLAVIVILAVILVIAVPSIMSTITESRKGALASSAKLIASSAETAYMSNQTLGIEKDIECSDVAQLTSEDYTSCSIKFVDGKAKVKIIGQGKFEGMAVCGGTKEEAEVVAECPGPVSFENDSWATIASAVQEGDTGNYNVGDTKTVDLGSLGTHTVRIANKSNDWEHCGEEGYSQTACGFVIEFADIITTHNMNPSGEYNGTSYSYGWNKDGWPGSQMYDYINVTEETGSGTIYNALPEELRNAIIDTTVVSSCDKSMDSSNFTSTDKLYLLSPEEVYGTSPSYDTSRGTSRQLDWYSTNGVTTSNYSGAIKKISSNSSSYWWLRSAYSYTTGYFYIVANDGHRDDYYAYNTFGVSPAFRLG